jgi:hypothetical protein
MCKTVPYTLILHPSCLEIVNAAFLLPTIPSASGLLSFLFAFCHSEEFV